MHARFGPDSDRARALVETGVTDAAGSALRDRFTDGASPLLREIGCKGDAGPASFTGFDEALRLHLLVPPLPHRLRVAQVVARPDTSG